MYPNAIVMTMAMAKKSIQTAPSTDSSKEIFRTYKELGVNVNKMTTFLKNKGYNAQAGPAIGGDVNYPMLAEKVGLGAVGKHGLLIGKASGPSIRIAAVYTDTENFDYTDNQEHFWIKSFCNNCNQCIKSVLQKLFMKKVLD
jgi:epoxyqueuosine reductase QueG